MTSHIRKKIEMRAAIFDLDGTLLDSMGVWEKIDRDFFKARGMMMPSDYPSAVRALSFRETARYTIDRFALDTDEESLMAEWREMARHEYTHCVDMKPYARDYLIMLKKSGISLATATSLHPELAIAALARNGAEHLFDAMCGTHETARGKEAPDVFVLAAERLGAAPEMCVVFEDVLEAAKNAKAAGMMLCCVKDDAAAAQEAELRAIADIYIEDFREAPLPICGDS